MPAVTVPGKIAPAIYRLRASLAAEMETMDIEELERRMRPGGLSADGFLGPAERLAPVMEKDRQTLAALGVTHAQLASCLDTLIHAAETSRHRMARVGVHEVAVTVFTGFQICPWAPNPDEGQCQMGAGVQYAHLDWQITNTRTGRCLEGPGLMVHLIRDHHFFEGFQSSRRIDPRQLVEHLELVPIHP